MKTTQRINYSYEEWKWKSHILSSAMTLCWADIKEVAGPKEFRKKLLVIRLLTEIMSCNLTVYLQSVIRNHCKELLKNWKSLFLPGSRMHLKRDALPWGSDQATAVPVGASLAVFEGKLGLKFVALTFPLSTWNHLLFFHLLQSRFCYDSQQTSSLEIRQIIIFKTVLESKDSLSAHRSASCCFQHLWWKTAQNQTGHKFIVSFIQDVCYARECVWS